jgi:hypothetical protein
MHILPAKVSPSVLGLWVTLLLPAEPLYPRQGKSLGPRWSRVPRPGAAQ